MSFCVYLDARCDFAESPGPSNLHDEKLHHDPKVLEGIDFPEILHMRPTMQDVATQTDWPETSSTESPEVSLYRKPKVTPCDVECQFPHDIVEEALSDHTYVRKTIQDTVHVPSSCHSLVQIEDSGLEDGYDSQVDLSPGLDDNPPTVICENIECEEHIVVTNVEESMDIVVSQESTSSGSQYATSVDGSEICSSQDSQNTYNNPDSITRDTYKERVFLVYDQQLKELLRFCPKCGSLIISENTIEVQNEGSQLSLKLTCFNNCEYQWQSQPPLSSVKGAGNLLITAGIFFCGIPFSKFTIKINTP